MNCDAVIGSRYSRLFGAPDEALGLVSFALDAVLALPGALGASGGGLLDLALLGLASGSLCFALVLAVIATAVLAKATGRPVRAFMSETSVTEDVAIEVFLLGDGDSPPHS